MTFTFNDEQAIYLYQLCLGLEKSYTKDRVLKEIFVQIDYVLDIEIRKRMCSKHRLNRDLLIAKLPEMIKKIKSKAPKDDFI